MRRYMYSLFVILVAYPAFSASFEPVVERKSGDWAAILYRNRVGNRLFCALETYAGQTVFRIIQYKASGDTFLEVFNPDWDLIEGQASFTIGISNGVETIGVEMRGERYIDAYVYDFTTKKTYTLVLGLLAQASGVEISDANGAKIVSFRGQGGSDAVADYANCSETNWGSLAEE